MSAGAGGRGVRPAMRKFVNLRQIEAFRAVMLTGTTKAAGEMLAVTQPAISRLVGALEAEAGSALFVRRHGRLQPTPEARALFEEIEKAFSGLDRIGAMLRRVERIGGGHLRILATTPMAHGLLPRALALLRQEVGEFNVALRSVQRREMRAWVDAQQFDLALTTYPLDYPAAATERFADVPGVCVLPAGHRLAGRRSIRAEDLADESFVSMPAETQARFRTDAVFERAGIRRRMVGEAQTAVLICDLVAAGLGVSVVDPFSASVARAGTVCLPFAPAIRFEFCVLYPLQRPRARLAEALAAAARRVAVTMQGGAGRKRYKAKA
ncbi:MAG: LysR family transcriptional regulator [Alphaproteobacteria bacterium]|nr:LysR family transcriptional regulator [Alphaproteobacteria bacterium]